MGMSIEQCESCSKDWTKCGTCPVMMQWVEEHKHVNRRKARDKWVNFQHKNKKILPEQ